MGDHSDSLAVERRLYHELLDAILDARARVRRFHGSSSDSIEAEIEEGNEVHREILNGLRGVLAVSGFPVGKICAPLIAAGYVRDAHEPMRMSFAVALAWRHLASEVGAWAIEYDVAHRIEDATEREPFAGGYQILMESAEKGSTVAYTLLRLYGDLALGSQFALRLADAFEALSLGDTPQIFRAPRKKGKGDVLARRRLEHLAVRMMRALHEEYSEPLKRARGQIGGAYGVADATVNDWCAANPTATGHLWGAGDCRDCSRRRLDADIKKYGQSYREAVSAPSNSGRKSREISTGKSR